MAMRWMVYFYYLHPGTPSYGRHILYPVSTSLRSSIFIPGRISIFLPVYLSIPPEIFSQYLPGILYLETRISIAPVRRSILARLSILLPVSIFLPPALDLAIR